MALVEDRGSSAVALVHWVRVEELDRAHVRRVSDGFHRFVADEVISAATPIDTVVLDLTTVTFVDSAGVATLLRFKATLAGLGLRLRVACASSAVVRTIYALGLEDRLGLTEENDQADQGSGLGGRFDVNPVGC